MRIALYGVMNKRIVTTTLLAVCLALGAGIPAALAAPPIVPRPATAQTSEKPAEVRQTAPLDRKTDAARYAQAERAQPAAADFEGGATFVIVGSTTAVVLGVVLLLILL